MSKRWIIRSVNTDLARSLAGSSKISELLASLLVNRDIRTPETVKAFLDADFRTGFRKPNQLPGADAVARRLFEAIQKGERIAVYGDYDVDGMTSTAILCKTLQDLGAEKVRHYIPSRLDEGYGVNDDALRKLNDEGIDLVVTVDCGINSLDEARLAAEIGLELLITDHHIPGPELPAATAIAHPQLVRFPAKDGSIVSAASLTSEQLAGAKCYPFPDLCGAGVALKVALRLNDISAGESGKKLSERRICELIVLAALATIADYVPLLDENRALVRAGLNLLQAGDISPGLTQLLGVATQGSKPPEVNAEFVAFQIQPRLNAAGRLGQAELAVELLLDEDAKRCRNLAMEIDSFNKLRRETEQEILKSAEEQIHKKFDKEDSAFVLAGPWHKGIIGIVANRLMEKYHKPVILIAANPLAADGDNAVGSGRSPSTFDLHEALSACRDHFVRFGGHSAAAGLTIDPKGIDAFREDFRRFTAEKIAEEERVAELFIDGEFPLGVFSRQTIDELSHLAPFGSGNAHPIFAARGVTVVNPKPMGPKGDHFSAEFHQGGIALRGIAFGRKNWFEEMQPYERPIDIVFEAKYSNYSRKVELTILDWRPYSAASSQ